MIVINGKKIAAKWEVVARANDPMTFTKTWRSDEVPGGLVHQLVQQHTEIGGKPFRHITETIYAPLDGIMPVLGDASPPAQVTGMAPPAIPQNRAVPRAAAQPPVAAPVAAPTTAVNRAEFQAHFNTAVTRYSRDRISLARFQTRGGSSATGLPPDVAAASGRLDGDLRAARAAISARDDSISERNLKSLEDDLQLIEDFLARN